MNIIKMLIETSDPQGTMIIGPVNYDQINGMGNVGDNANINYLGFAVLMTPKKFLKLASPRNFSEESSGLEGIKKALQENKPIGSPFLSVIFDEKNEKPKSPKIRQHEGRTRMQAIFELYGDIEILVHIFPYGGMRARHITQEMIKGFQNEAISQNGNMTLGPNFNEKVWLDGHWISI